MRWVDIAVRADFCWPDCLVEIPFEGRTIVLQPLTEELSSAASVFFEEGTTFDEGGTILSRFLSRLSWSLDGAIEELFAAGSNHTNRPGRLGRGAHIYAGQCPPWRFLYLPLPAAPEADLALGLFREGLSLNSDSLAFLSFFKILNISMSNGSDQIAWINRNLHHVKFGRELERLTELRTTHSDIGSYLYVQGRCAVAHANTSPIAHPDNFGDKRRLRDDLPLIRELAVAFIEHDLGVLSPGAFLQMHRNSDLSSPEILVPKPVRNGRVRFGAYDQDA